MKPAKPQIDNELFTACENLTAEQKKLVRAEWQKDRLSYGIVAVKLGLTRSYVHSYFRLLNGTEAA
jgi:hypothetical protein